MGIMIKLMLINISMKDMYSLLLSLVTNDILVKIGSFVHFLIKA